MLVIARRLEKEQLMSLLLSDFESYATGSAKISYLEIRLGEQYVVNFYVRSRATGLPIDITGWTFAPTSTLYTARFCYGQDGSLERVEHFKRQTETYTYAGMVAGIDNAPLGRGYLKIPSYVNPNPTDLVDADTYNTMLNIIEINATFPSSQASFDAERRLLLGLVIRYGEQLAY